ncbi:MAG: glycine--tRNA ligase [Candidatus Thermoplasmatota archaeon]|jgi:glycyl-tRNA synthetase|nr:glycine--tRNA ligase [Candidatus Thermoplasmatota archaeon]MDP7264256.1 glycine--tRNA ligase [Candidatus Thermoplasmatota archaeon]
MTEKQNIAKTTYSDVISLARRRGFLYPSFDLYGGVAGFYDWGPVGSLLKNNFLAMWREAYVEGEGFFEIDCPNVTPEVVFKASGHLDEFTDYMTSCNKCSQHFRADHLVAELHPNPDSLGKEELAGLISEKGVKCPECKGDLTELYAFNLMFKTNIGPTSERPGYLRPETAQGIFLNFRNLYIHNRQKLPMGVVQIGKGFRNEISPRQGVIRVREFQMAELELFVDPENPNYVNYPLLKHISLSLLPDTTEKEILSRTVEEAVEEGIIDSKILAYFVALTQEILLKAGLDPNRMRFRQHEAHEMAHYAKDCWDAEALTDFGWVEIVGIADRSCYDLEQHMKHSGVDLRAMRQLAEPKMVKVRKIEADMKKMGPVFRGRAGKIRDKILALDDDAVAAVESGQPLIVSVDNERISISTDMFTISQTNENRSIERFMPHVIEPSHGVDRILYCVLEHSLKRTVDESGEETRVLHLPPVMAPYLFAVFPLMSRDGLTDNARELYNLIKNELRGRGSLGFYDESGSIGRRYSRMDEIGTPYCLTVDYQTLEDGSFTIRERDSKEQARINKKQVRTALRDLVDHGISLKDWSKKNGVKLISRDN